VDGGKTPLRRTTMFKRVLSLLVLVTGIVIALPHNAFASTTIIGRITDYSPTSLSVLDKESVTLTLDGATTYGKWITQKPWQEDTRLNASSLAVGRLVAVHVRKDNGNVADWVQVATDVPPLVSVTASAFPRSFAAPAQTAPKANASDVLKAGEVKALIAKAKTPADHIKLQKHFLALAAKYDAEAVEHAAEAQAYRKNPTFMESKAPSGPGTAAHCDRFAELARESAKEARDLASAHEHMAAAK
jgi:hypothetical protein